jgi:hypothetical protein
VRFLILLLLLLAAPARGMTVAEFDQYFVGGALVTSGPRTGGCATIVHDRLFRFETTLAEQRAFAATPGTLNAAFKARMESLWASKHGSSTNSAEYSVLIGNVMLDADKLLQPQYVQECTTFVGRLIDQNVSCGWPTGRDIGENHGGTGGYSPTAVVYDLTYPYLNRTRRLSAIRKLVTAINASDYDDSGGALWQWTNYKLAPLLAIYGDSANATLNSAIRAELVDTITQWETDVADCMNASDVIGYQDQYFAARHGSRLFAVPLLKACFPGYDSPLYDVTPIANGSQFYRFMCRPDAFSVSGTKQIAMEKGPDKWNTKNWFPVGYQSMHGMLFDDEDAWQFAERLGAADYGIGPNNTSGIAAIWEVVLWHDPTKYALAPISDLSRYAWSPRRGVFIGRSAWSDFGASNTDVRVYHYPGYVQGAGHRNAGHFMMNRGPDNLFWDAGYYLTDLEDEYQVWLAQSTSHNTIEIAQSGNTTFEGESAYYAVDKAGPSSCTALETDPNLAFGWQSEGDAEQGDTLFGGACNNPGVLREQLRKRGELVQSAIVEGECYYIASDLSLAYWGTKQQGVRRAWYYDGDATVVILDQVVAGVDVARVCSLLHTVNAPMHQAGTIQVLRGGGIASADSIRVDADGTTADTHGGIYRIRGNTIAQASGAAVKTTYGGSAGWAFPLEVRNATDGRTGHLLSIGGPNKLGQHWMQTKYPCVQGLYSSQSNTVAGTAFECWVMDADSVLTGWNAAPGSHASGSACTPNIWHFGVSSIDCGGGVTRFRASGTQYAQRGDDVVATRNNRTGAGEGHGKDAGDWTTYTVIPNPAPGDLCESAVVCVATSSTASKPSVKYTHTGEIYAVAVDTGAGWRVHVVPTATFTPRAPLIEWTNPLTSENATIRVPGLEPGATYDLEHDGEVWQQLTADGVGYLTWSHEAGAVETFALRKSNAPAPVPDPDPGAGYTLMQAVGYHPRERTLLQAGSGTLLALYWAEGAYGTPIWAQISRDNGSSWLDLDGAQGSSTEVIADAVVFGSGYMAPRADAGLGAALDPASNDLWLAYGTQRLSAAHAVQAGGLRVTRLGYDSALDTWSITPEYTLDAPEAAGTANDRVGADAVVMVSQSSQAYVAWRGPSGAGYAIHSRRIRVSTPASLSSCAALTSSAQYPQLVEQPAGTIWLLASVRVTGTQDSIRVRTATDGSGAQWGATSRISAIYAGANGEFAACRGPSGPWVGIRHVPGSDDLLAYAYWTGSAWVTGETGLVDRTVSHLAVTPGGIDRVVVTTRDTSGATPALDRAYWSLADGWSPWVEIWEPTAGLAYPHVVSLSPSEFCAWAWRTAGVDGFESRRFSIPPPADPTGACCVSTTCTITTAEACAGTWQGADTACSPNPCVSPPASGACCYPDGTCAVTTEDGCGGEYQGDATDCDPNPCSAGPPSQSGRRRRVLLAGR